MYRIRFHGRGGQGIKTASRILGTAFFRSGYEVQDAPVYGAERRGAPMFACVRAGHEPVRDRGLITTPDLVVVADETLFDAPAANVLLGCSERTVFLICVRDDAASHEAHPGITGTVVRLPMPQVSAEGLFVGAVCAGAAARLVGTIPRENLIAALQEELSAFGAEALGRNLAHALAAFDAVAAHAGIVAQGAAIDASNYAAPQWVDVPLESARISAPDIFGAATSVEVRTGLWRTMRPQIDYARCNHCTWVCSTFCPDSAISVRADGAPEIDFDHCKGCMVCVAVCPPHAIGAVPEYTAAAKAEAKAS